PPLRTIRLPPCQRVNEDGEHDHYRSANPCQGLAHRHRLLVVHRNSSRKPPWTAERTAWCMIVLPMLDRPTAATASPTAAPTAICVPSEGAVGTSSWEKAGGAGGLIMAARLFAGHSGMPSGAPASVRSA